MIGNIISDSTSTQCVQDFITANWNETVRYCPEDQDTLIGLPFPYTIPCRKGAFQELYYWDTYFTVVGLLWSGRTELALNNTRNLLAQVKRFGFVPNGNRTYYLNRSQPPYLGPLVALVADATNDIEFAREAASLLAREYQFWTTQRLAPTGLSHHGNHASPDELQAFFPTVQHRLGLPDSKPEEHLGLTYRTMAECETGWDFNSRFDRRCPDFCPIDLNSNLWLYEVLLSRWTTGIEGEIWEGRARRRLAWVNEYCWNDETGIFCDYDHVRGRPSPVISAAAFQPLWTGLASAEQAASVVAHVLPRLEFDFGVSSVAPDERPSPYQWDHPNAWPCIQHLVYRGLDRYGYHQDAQRIAEKYITCVCRSFEQTGDLWEKYNVLDGSHHTTEEAGYLINPVNLASGEANAGHPADPPAMMGWTAGVFMDAVRYLAGDTRSWLNSL